MSSYTDYLRRRRATEAKYGTMKEVERRWQSTVEAARVARGHGRQFQIPQKTQKQKIYSIEQLVPKKATIFVFRETNRVNNELKKISSKIPTLEDIAKAGYRYGKAHPRSAKLIYNSMDAQARIIRKVVPREAGIPAAKAMYAFSDGTIKGIRNEPLKALAFAALPGAVGVVAKGARYVPIASKVVKSEKAMKAAAAAFDIGYTHNVYTRVNAPVLGGYKEGKTTETSKTLLDGSTEITTTTELVPFMRKPTVSEKAERLGYVFSTEAGPMVFGAMGMEKVSKARFNELSRTAKTKIKEIKKTIKGKDVKTTVKTKISKTRTRKKIQKRRSDVDKAIKAKEKQLIKQGKLKTEKQKSDFRKQYRKKINTLKRKLSAEEKRQLKTKGLEITGIKNGKLVLKKSTVGKAIKRAEKRKAKISKREAKRLKEVAKAKKAKEKQLIKEGKLRTPKQKEVIRKKYRHKIGIEKNKLRITRERLQGLIKKTKTAYNKLSPSVRKAKKARYKQTIDQLETLVNKSWELEKWKIDEVKLTKEYPKFESKVEPLHIRMQKARDFAYYTISNMERVTAVKPKAKTKLKRGELQAIIEAKRKARIKEYERSPQVEAGGQILIVKAKAKAKTKPKIDMDAERAKANELMDQLVAAEKKAQTEAKAINKIKSDTQKITKQKTVQVQKPKQKQVIKQRQKQVLKHKQKLVAKQKRLAVYRAQLQKYLTQLKQQYKIIQVAPVVPKPITMTNQMIRQIQRTDHVIIYIDKLINDVIYDVKIIQKYISEPIPKPISTFKQTQIPRIPKVKVKPLLRKKEPVGKKKKKKVKKGVKEAYVRNPVPSIKQFIG